MNGNNVVSLPTCKSIGGNVSVTLPLNSIAQADDTLSRLETAAELGRVLLSKTGVAGAAIVLASLREVFEALSSTLG